MTRLRYPFAEIGLRCRLCGFQGCVDTTGGRVGARMIDWRRQHAAVCVEWPRWAERKGLRLDQHDAVLYPGEDGPYVPRSRGAEGADPADQEPDLLELPPEAFDQGTLI